ncbi:MULTISPECIES: multifunctional oxoglutarate decarboxylase/oxoglutarate dehydrogenase thiamine pyrophosphate-binding subunit/dihydrolipoyllysine-residue succinyltransferase subunit [Kocuria]|uniref:Multifunctional 2-oxoglutarate metabolism enzyme n=1 Tax=Kocuria varians TaxID=1272 RepID=A0A7D7L0X6_KOCVA|nr:MULTISPECIES: multifunctional oxoglutarate decarboxylase/oxoglutarate dehydrogenase thiamine pyrophosphate-binding subunit/dihydrolipoyllysine-residue succinyltransferase subunit [Kocuria]MDN5630576.1 multifunctional oxoglutarate decarboxylase/oxoglutarate dehydrogenase thiamine pyrophosphate-binding subunit/dihydrolipoyllysine-residue succinyltransferase subunit [Kocuria sp.]QMS57486.1 Multifunctional 2-oxoglutarate metabolism enzyme [Kocuria varians]RUP84548.1 multifunctional oxoglutarate d
MPEQPQHLIPEEFAGNEWLVDELFEKYQADKNSVDKKWWPIFEQMDGGDKPSEVASSSRRSDSDAKPATSSNQASGAQGSGKQASPKQSSATQSSGAQASGAKSSGTGAAASSSASAPKAAAAPERAKSPAPAATGSKAKGRPAGVDTEADAAEASGTKRPIRAQPEDHKGDASAKDAKEKPAEDTVVKLRGPAKAVAANMEASLTVPTATTVRAVPAKLLIDNRLVINSHLARNRGGKVSFTHLVGYAVIRALSNFPSMNVIYDDSDGKPAAVHPAHVNFGIAIDIPNKDGSRNLVVPNVKGAEEMSFLQFWTAYEDIVKRGRNGALTMDDYAGTTVSLTNPGGIGTVHSVPRLSKGQACIIGVGALDYPAEYKGASPRTIARNAVSKVITLTSTYDHRVIQGAGSGEFLKLVEHYLLGGDDFYDHIFEALRIPYEPVRWAVDNQVNPEIQINKVARIQQLIHAYRVRGHLMADTNPLEYVMRKHPDLDIRTYGLTLWDLEREWPTGGFGGQNLLTLRVILGRLRDAYCRTVGVEYMHIQEPEQREWFQSKLERDYQKPAREEQFHILERLNAAEAFETFLQTKYVGQKRFSLEGGESLIPLLDAIISDAADASLAGVGIAMAHRGRLNVLTNIAGKSYAQVFREFEGSQDPRASEGSGDVKYHLGTEGVFTSDNGNETQVYLAANPSHLEAADPVIEGIARAKTDVLGAGPEGNGEFPVLPIQVHGDAAMAGQGIVYEVMQMSGLDAYNVGGTIHVVVNNQVGFTTSPSAGRTSTYSTDVGRTVQAPIFHVNADDPEAVTRVAQLAFEYRQRFHHDVVIDLVCYRRRGHNEGDDPSMTQPLMYSLIDGKRSTRKVYTENLVGRGDITQEEADRALKDYQERLERVFAETHEAQNSTVPLVTGDAAAIANIERPSAQQADSGVSVPKTTAISEETARRIGEAYVDFPENFTMHRKLQKLAEKRREMTLEGGIDWGMGELMAFGSLVMDGVPVRMSGQDVRRGTFTQRHAVFFDAENGAEWTPLNNLSADQARFSIYNSLLSEYGVLGFEYGYSVERPEALTVWEAQFGDFINGAQTIVDEFISSAEQKWGQRSNLVMLLPHGFEGQGPDHSSARIERFLSLCAEKNMIVAQPSTPANHFHLLRRQAYSRPRRPLVVATPKQLLRLKAAASPVEEFTRGNFQSVIPDAAELDDAKVTDVILVSGRLYYDLAAQRKKSDDHSTAIVRVEQLYPLPTDEIKAQLDRYPDARIIWAQDEPANQGAWPFMAVNLVPQLDRPVTLASRPASASPANGSAKRHAAELETLVQQAFDRGE